MNTESAVPCVAREYIDRLSVRLVQEKKALVLFLVELAEFDQKKLGIELGYPSTLACLMGELHLAESSACRRIAAARLLARFPLSARYLVSHRLTMTTLVALKDVLVEANAEALFERASGCTESEVRELVLRMRLQAQQRPPELAGDLGEKEAEVEVASGAAAGPEVALTGESPLPPGLLPRPAAEEVSMMTLWVTPAFRELLSEVINLCSHQVPSGKKEEVLRVALEALRGDQS